MMFSWRVLQPLWWFGLMERTKVDAPFEPPRWRKTALFDRFLSFDVGLTESHPEAH